MKRYPSQIGNSKTLCIRINNTFADNSNKGIVIIIPEEKIYSPLHYIVWF